MQELSVCLNQIQLRLLPAAVRFVLRVQLSEHKRYVTKHKYRQKDHLTKSSFLLPVVAAKGLNLNQQCGTTWES